MNNTFAAPVKKEIGVSAPSGYKEIKCSECGAEWYVPEDAVAEDMAFICPECSKAKVDSIAESKAAAEAAIKG